MKKFTIGLVIVFWMIFTILLAVSIVVLIEEGESVWFKIGRKLVNSLVE